MIQTLSDIKCSLLCLIICSCVSNFAYCVGPRWEDIQSISDLDKQVTLLLQSVVSKTHIPADAAPGLLKDYKKLAHDSSFRHHLEWDNMSVQQPTVHGYQQLGMLRIFQATRRIFTQHSPSEDASRRFFHTYFLSNSEPSIPLIEQMRTLLEDNMLDLMERKHFLQGITFLLRAFLLRAPQEGMSDILEDIERIFCALARLTGLKPHEYPPTTTMRLDQQFHLDQQRQYAATKKRRGSIPIQDDLYLELLTKRIQILWETGSGIPLSLSPKEQQLCAPATFKASQTHTQKATSIVSPYISWVFPGAQRKACPK